MPLESISWCSSLVAACPPESVIKIYAGATHWPLNSLMIFLPFEFQEREGRRIERSNWAEGMIFFYIKHESRIYLFERELSFGLRKYREGAMASFLSCREKYHSRRERILSLHNQIISSVKKKYQRFHFIWYLNFKKDNTQPIGVTHVDNVKILDLQISIKCMTIVNEIKPKTQAIVKK